MIEQSGIPVYKGLVIAPIYVYEEEELDITKAYIEAKEVDETIVRWNSVLQTAKNQLQELKGRAKSPEEAEILGAHLMLADDPMLIGKIKERIEKRLCSLELAIEETKDEIMSMFLCIEDDYLKARAADIEDITRRFLRLALGTEHKGFSEITEEVILVAKDIKPSETSGMNQYIKGLLLEEGSQTSHAVIMAKAKGIPTIVGLSGIGKVTATGDLAILDSINNKVILLPTEELLQHYQRQKEQLTVKQQKLKMIMKEEAITKDGQRIKLYGNIGDSAEADYVIDNGGKGIGLFRTEFLYMNAASFPSEEEQFQEYRKTVEKDLEEVIIRTLDIGGDKKLPYYQFKEESNPFLGFRALRFTLANMDLFKAQVRAILRASAYGPASIMFPMVSSLEEVLQAKALLEQCKRELAQEQKAFDPNIRIGIMIEIPAAVTIADILIEEVDFFSIGTNDLCQYTLAVDRMNKEVAYLYQPLHPSIVRMIRQTVAAAHSAGKEVGICGEMAGDVSNALVLLALGVDELSMSPAVIPEMKAFIRQLDYEDIKQLTECIFHCKTTREIKELLKKKLENYIY